MCLLAKEIILRVKLDGVKSYNVIKRGESKMEKQYRSSEVRLSNRSIGFRNY
jgi:hypothetical protein